MPKKPINYKHAAQERQLENLASTVRRLTPNGTSVKVLEAGCGEFPSPLGLGEDETFIVGIDVSERQVARNQWADEKVLGDLETYDLAPAAFDVVVSWDVLEHLSAPEAALSRFVRTVKPGGILVIKVPNLLSGKGLITKLTPYAFHVWAYKHIFGYRNPGEDDRPPFRTFLRRTIRPRALLAFAQAHGLSVEMFGTWEADKQSGVRRRYRLTGRRWRLIHRAVKTLSFGRLDLEATELVAVFRRPVEDQPPS